MVKGEGLRILGKLVYVCWFRSGHVGRFDKGGLVSSLRRIGGRVGFTNRLSFRSNGAMVVTESNNWHQRCILMIINPK